jgi:hypothetical protein
MGYPLNRVNMRRALEAVSTFFDRMSAECLRLVDVMSTKSDASVKAVEEIKRVYLQLLTLPVEDLKALIDSFELDLLPMQITRLISEDRDDGALDTSDSSSLSQPQPFVRSSGPIAQQLTAQTMGLPLESLKVNVVEDDEESEIFLFSPNTEDMNSIEQSTHTGTVDDLRRTVGSFDNEEVEEVEEEREGPPSHVPQAVVAKKNKKRRSIWKRRQPRWQQVAE